MVVQSVEALVAAMVGQMGYLLVEWLDKQMVAWLGNLWGNVLVLLRDDLKEQLKVDYSAVRMAVLLVASTALPMVALKAAK